MPRLFRPSIGALLVIASACAPPDPVTRTTGEGGSSRAPDAILNTEALQQIADLTHERDATAVRARLTDADPVVRARAALSMATLRDRGAAVDLRALLADPDPRVRADAAFALAHYAAAGEAGDQMSDMLATETDAVVRSSLIDALGKAGQSRSIGVLLDLDGADRAAATLALSRALIRGSAPAGTVDSLVARMRDPDPMVRRNAAYFMERVEDVLVWIDHRRGIRAALDALPADDPAALSIIEGLGRRFDVFVLPRIVHWAQNATDWRVRANAMEALEDMGLGGSRLSALLAGLDDPSPHVRAQAAASLAASPPDDDVRAWLLDWIERRPGERMALGAILSLLARAGDEEVVLGWVAELDPADESGWTAVAIPALSELAGEAALDRLIEAAGSSNRRIAQAAAAALQERLEITRRAIDEGAFIEVLERSVQRSNPRVVGGLARLMGDTALVDAGGRERLAAIAVQSDGLRREAAVRALEAAGALDLVPEELRVMAGDLQGAGPQGAAGTPRANRVEWSRLAELGPRPRWVLHTDRGRVVLELAADQAPLTVQRLTDLARSGRFDGVPFHRVVANFVAQGGDLSRAPEVGPPAGRLLSEITRIPFERGVIGMANTGSLDTESSQFFINHDRLPHLDGGYTAFGWVIDGMDVVDRIELGDRILATEVVPGGR